MTKRFVALCALVVASTVSAVAGERVDLHFTNALDEEIVAIRVEYSTPYDEPRYDASQIYLRPGGEYRIGVQGTVLPERIILDLATKSYDFVDLSGLDPSDDMFLEVMHEGGMPVLRRTDSDGGAAVAGEERDYLTTANRPNAVDRDYLTAAKTWDEVADLLAQTVLDAQERFGAPEFVDVEAGAIMNQAHAQARCPEAVAEWGEANGREDARWNGNWATTVPEEMSVCGCVTGTADLDATAFSEDEGWGEIGYFPVVWKDWIGVARVENMDKDDPDAGIGFGLRFRIPEEGGAEMLDELLSDLRVDGYRPWRFAMRTWDEATDEGGEVDLVFHDGDGDKYDDQDALQESLFAAYADGTLAEASAAWVQEDAFEAGKAGGDVPAGPGALVLFSRGTFEAAFVPDGRALVL